MPKALLYMQVHVCVMGVGGGYMYTCVCICKGRRVEYSVPCPSKSPLQRSPQHTYIITHPH